MRCRERAFSGSAQRLQPPYAVVVAACGCVFAARARRAAATRVRFYLLTDGVNHVADPAAQFAGALPRSGTDGRLLFSRVSPTE